MVEGVPAGKAVGLPDPLDTPLPPPLDTCLLAAADLHITGRPVAGTVEVVVRVAAFLGRPLRATAPREAPRKTEQSRATVQAPGRVPAALAGGAALVTAPAVQRVGLG